MRIMKRGEKGFTLVELLIVIAIMGVLTAVAIPTYNHFYGAGESEARQTELLNVQVSVQNMIFGRGLNPATIDNDFPETGDVATNDMTEFPGAGNTLSGYINPTTMNYYYTIDADGIVHQYTSAGKAP